ncbi:glutamate ABC transporter substrate-binding protein [Nocardia sp. CA-135398]|uniref:glutamate ABC transporter substrate-binding protein n=1 Tax=Nocardia sp. CA-135398 TaxID=3239977 RepID=UPI003D982287
MKFPRSVLIPLATIAAIGAVAVFGTQSSVATGISPQVAQSPQFPAGSTMERIARSGVLRVSTRFDHPGLSARNLRGDQEGFEVDLVRYIAGRLGLSRDRIDWIEGNSASREELLQQNKVDIVVSTFSITAKRQKVVGFGGTYLDVTNDLVVPSGNPEHVSDPHTPSGIRVCSTLGGAVSASLRKEFPDVNLVEFDVSSKCIDALKNGSVDALATQGPIGAGYVSKNSTDLEMLNKPFTNEVWGVGITKGDSEFCAFLNTVVTEFYTDGSADKAWADSLGRYTTQRLTLPKQQSCS